ncbi:MAG: hypothetical protein FJ147_18260 [Deltaproteobacteria bacterium]|nr:hypothetical protein [Deltaproteobacteria bacterium]
MFGFDIFTVAAASLDLTADLTPSFVGLSAVTWFSAIAIPTVAVILSLRDTRQAASFAQAVESAHAVEPEHAEAA